MQCSAIVRGNSALQKYSAWYTEDTFCCGSVHIFIRCSDFGSDCRNVGFALGCQGTKKDSVKMDRIQFRCFINRVIGQTMSLLFRNNGRCQQRQSWKYRQLFQEFVNAVTGNRSSGSFVLAVLRDIWKLHAVSSTLLNSSAKSNLFKHNFYSALLCKCIVCFALCGRARVVVKTQVV